jgi:hypothetical protein
MKKENTGTCYYIKFMCVCFFFAENPDKSQLQGNSFVKLIIIFGAFWKKRCCGLISLICVQDYSQIMRCDSNDIHTLKFITQCCELKFVPSNIDSFG